MFWVYTFTQMDYPLTYPFTSKRDRQLRGMVSGEIPEQDQSAPSALQHETPRRFAYLCRDPKTRHNVLVWIEGRRYDIRHDVREDAALQWAATIAPNPTRPLIDFWAQGVRANDPEKAAGFIALESLRRRINALRRMDPEPADEETLP